MRRTVSPLTSIQKLFLALAAVLALAFMDYRLFVSKSDRIELYDGLHAGLSDIRMSIMNIEFTLDMFVVASRFEGTTVEIIKEDMARLDRKIDDIIEDKRYFMVLSDNAPISDAIASVYNDWQTIKGEVARLDEAMSQDEVILIHNAVDMNTILVTEKLDRILSSVAESRMSLFEDAKGQALKSIAGFILISLVAAMVYYRRVLRPIARAVDVARDFSAGFSSARFNEGAGAFAALFGELNPIFDSVAESGRKADELKDSYEERLKKKAALISALGSVAVEAGRSLALGGVYACAAEAPVSAGVCSASAIYVFEGESLTLRASSGLAGSIRGASVALEERAAAVLREGAPLRSFRLPEEFPDRALGEVMAGEGMTEVVCVPIVYNGETKGVFLAAYREGRPSVVDRSFLNALSSHVAAVTGHAGMYQRELASKRFIERAVNQLPFGIGIFDREGVPVVFNSLLRRMLGVAPDFDFARGFKLFEDMALATSGAIAPVGRTFDGVPFHAEIGYDPSLVSKHGISGPARWFKVRFLPIYDAGGDIHHVAFVCEDGQAERKAAAEGGG